MPNTEVISGGALARQEGYSSPIGFSSDDRATLLTVLLQEFNPATTYELMLVHELARRADQTRKFDSAHDDFVAEGSGALSSLLGMHTAASESSRAVGIARVAASGPAEALLRQSLAASLGSQRVLALLRSIQAARRLVARTDMLDVDDRFASESQCVTYLVRRFQLGEILCPRCRQRGKGSFIARRHCWEFSCCKTQVGIRSGTVMQRSPLPLKVWFSAIRILILYPNIPTAQLAKQLGVGRAQTVRAMAKKIWAAVADEDGSRMLAGLDKTCFPVT